jgi:hypothetical protein
MFYMIYTLPETYLALSQVLPDILWSYIQGADSEMPVYYPESMQQVQLEL